MYRHCWFNFWLRCRFFLQLLSPKLFWIITVSIFFSFTILIYCDCTYSVWCEWTFIALCFILRIRIDFCSAFAFQSQSITSFMAEWKTFTSIECIFIYSDWNAFKTSEYGIFENFPLDKIRLILFRSGIHWIHSDDSNKKCVVSLLNIPICLCSFFAVFLFFQTFFLFVCSIHMTLW